MSNPVPGTTSLLGELDKKLMVLLRDGRTLIGYLRSIDQFANLVLHRTIERIHVGNKFGDIPRGIFIIRGENVVLCGEVDPSVKIEEHLVRVEIEEILELQQIELDAKQEKDRLRLKSLHESGLNANNFDFLQEDF